ncbi:mitochondrial genome maintenance exonuclease 1-like isoform X1 [Neodiprion fabricii]|uniref:mitochondrial genome maintenance exonuclease 1-like isoform X1 n=2 Tax=Neodiprion fabricii TaxID=2872261 RepID=UPI001ED8DCCF|nr:mitochondrial genome maintenance exonuclease 1-like isoform X1 [Neodiprion fabricii]XP_046430277.1 mitochondrial genome maintenance exonuclease 1-like isoform X1 [Neodiprion fabricii]XP_046430278.1 mitochondrial genome maintenance exonuclease 1-like isoform X1 [Neodiprion fabricii]
MKVMVVFAVPCLTCLRKVFQSVLRSKTTRAQSMMRFQSENKQLYGKVLETKKQKIARAKHIDEEVLNEAESQIDSEAFWLSKVDNEVVRRVKINRKSLPSRRIKIEETSKNARKKQEAIYRTSLVDAEVEQSRMENVPGKVEHLTHIVHKNKRLGFPSEILIKNITNFSYLDKSKDAGVCTREVVSIPVYHDSTTAFIPSVSKILNQTMSEESKLNLELWKKRMIALMGEKGFEEHQQETLCYGRQFHSIIHNFLTQKPINVPDALEKSWQSVQQVLKEVHGVAALESHTIHSKLHYRGVVDCVALYRGNLCVIEWKKSDRMKNTIRSTFDAPIQAASYIGALNSDENYKFQVQNGLIVIGYTSGEPASVYEMNSQILNMYWKQWLRRLQQYYVVEDLKAKQHLLVLEDQ